MTRRDKSIGLDAIVLTIYLAVAPMHQTLVLSNGSTVVKYLALLTMAACMLWGYVQERRFIVTWDLIWPVLLVFGWFALTILWSDSRSAALSSLISIGSYCALILIVGSKRWNDKEKKLILLVLILSCTFYALILIRSAALTRRATLSFSMNGEIVEADQNTVACNLGIGALAAFNWFLRKKERGGVRWAALACMFVTLAGIVSTGSRGGMIAFLAGAICLFYKQTSMNAFARSRFIIVAILLLLFYWLVFDLNILRNEILITRFTTVEFGSMYSRTEIWEQYLSLLFHRPIGFLCGYGCGCDAVAHAEYMGRNWLRASHNDLISILCQTGIPGVLLTASFICHLWKRSEQDKNLFGCACIVLALVGSMGINFFKSYGWWNAMILAYIGMDGALAETSNEASTSLPFGCQGKQSYVRSAS